MQQAQPQNETEVGTNRQVFLMVMIAMINKEKLNMFTMNENTWNGNFRTKEHIFLEKNVWMAMPDVNEHEKTREILQSKKSEKKKDWKKNGQVFLKAKNDFYLSKALFVCLFFKEKALCS